MMLKHLVYISSFGHLEGLESRLGHLRCVQFGFSLVVVNRAMSEKG